MLFQTSADLFKEKVVERAKDKVNQQDPQQKSK